MRRRRCFLIAGTYGFFQIIMPLIGWVCVHTITEVFSVFRRFIPWVALALLLFLGIRMIIESLRKEHSNEELNEENVEKLGVGTLILQGIATSIDALSVGLTMADYDLRFAFAESLIIGAVTFGLCMGALIFGRLLGKKIGSKAEIIGGIILICIGIEIFIKGLITS